MVILLLKKKKGGDVTYAISDIYIFNYGGGFNDHIFLKPPEASFIKIKKNKDHIIIFVLRILSCILT